MKLLLVDDEEYTRLGIADRMPWAELGVTELELAEDGLDGARKAEAFGPDIVLSDVRMPRMDGIAMSMRIRESFPDCGIIFMSGYSDKEYLKSAIKLSAVNYIEKPIDMEELRSTIENAVRQSLERETEKRSRIEIDRRLTVSMPALRNLIAIGLLKRETIDAQLEEYIRIAYPDVRLEGRYLTFLVSILEGTGEGGAGGREAMLSAVCDLLESRLALENLETVIVGRKNDSIIVAHISLERKGAQPFANSDIGSICYGISRLLESYCDCVIVTGKPADRLFDVCESYNAAVVSLQRGFYCKPGAVLFYEEEPEGRSFRFDEEALLPFHRAVQAFDEQACAAYVRRMADALRKYELTPTSQVRVFFANLLVQLKRKAEAVSGAPSGGIDSDDAIHDALFRKYFLADIEAFALSRIERFFAATRESQNDNLLAQKIKLYIREHYANPELSLNGIAGHFSVSVSHMCVIFKKESDWTVNQYLNECRMEEAKQLLQGGNRKIRDIAELVGYRDSNYFNKAFKKSTGFTPLEYRELKL